MTNLEQIRELNRWPHVEIGFCLRCGAYYSLTQLRLPSKEADDGIALTSIEHPPGLIDDIAAAIRSGKLRA